MLHETTLQEVTLVRLPEAPGVSVHLNNSADSAKSLLVPAEQLVSITVSWTPTQFTTLHDSLHFSWRKEHLHVVLSGKATAPPPSALIHAAGKRTMSDISDTPCKAGSVLPHTPTGQKVVKTQRVGISPGHPTFEAAMRNSTAATPSRQRAGDTPGLSRYAAEVASDGVQVGSFLGRIQELANSPEAAPPERPRVRLKRCAGKVPLKSLRLSVNQQVVTEPLMSLAAKPTSAAARHGAPASRNGSSGDPGKIGHQGFSFFHSGYNRLLLAVNVTNYMCAGAIQYTV